MTLVDNPTFDENPTYDEYNGEQEDVDPDQKDIVYADSGESLVVCQVLNIAEVDDES